MKKQKVDKQLVRAIVGSVATIGAIEITCGKKFIKQLANDISPLDLESRLTFWNLVNVRMNPDEKTHIYYGPMAHHPKMLELVEMVCKEIVKNEIKSNN